MQLEITGYYFPTCMILVVYYFSLTYEQQLTAAMFVSLLALGCARVKRLQYRYQLINLVQYVIFSNVKVFPSKDIFECSHCPIHRDNGVVFHQLV